MSDLILLMSKIDYARSLDHKALILYILLHKVDVDTLCYFSELGGFRILRNWIEKCIKGRDDVELLRSIIAVCFKIPWNRNTYEHVKQSEIGKWLKKASKYSSPEKDCTSSQAESKAVMALWKEKMEEFNNLPNATETVIQLDINSGTILTIDANAKSCFNVLFSSACLFLYVHRVNF